MGPNAFSPTTIASIERPSRRGQPGAFGWGLGKLLQQRFELGIGRRPEVKRLPVVILREFHVRRALFGVDNRQVEMRVGVLRVDLDRAANLLFTSGAPAFLVEDDAELCATLLETLSSDHWDVTAAPSSEAALAVLQQDETIGILVTDIALGAGMSGIDLAHAAVARCPDLSVILTSGYPGAQGTAGYRFEVLQKPFTGAQLVARIQITRAARERLSANGVADRG